MRPAIASRSVSRPSRSRSRSTTAAASATAALGVALALALAACGGKADHPQIHVAAAADLARAFGELGPAFRDKTGIEPVFTFGSTGLLTKQIEQGAPFDLLAAANVDYAATLAREGKCDGATQTMYARGRLVVWTPSRVAPPTSLADLADPRFAHIAIANPEHAPYGVAARAALEKAAVWAQVEPRMVYGENVQQALQFAQSGNADAAVIALSLSVVTDGGKALPVDPSMHDPIDQALIVCGTGPGADGARKFAAFVASPQGREIMTRYGFLLPGEGGPGPHAEAAPAAPIPEAEARGLYAAWLAAEGGREPGALARLYAARFTGVTRDGVRVRRWDRARWLRDRGAELAGGGLVRADDVRVRVAGPVAVIELTLRRGAAATAVQLLVVRTPDGLRVGREERGDAAAAADAAATRAPALGFVVDVDGSRYAIVPDAARGGDGGGAGGGSGGGSGGAALGDLARAPTTGDITPLHGNAPMWAFEPIDAAKAPPAIAAWRGRRVRVYGDAGSCDGTLGELVSAAAATPPPATLHEWGGADGHRPLTAGQEARSLAALAPPVLAARLDATCPGAWVDLAGGAEGVVYAAGAPEPALAAAMSRALRGLPEWAALQREYAQQYGGRGEWIGAEAGAIETRVFTPPGGGDRVAAARARAGTGCGDFAGELTALWRVPASGALVALGAPGQVPYPRAVTDVDRDGALELLTDTDVFVADAGGGVARARHLDLHDYDCPC